MAPHPSYPRTRLYTDQKLGVGMAIELPEKQAHYLLQVLRCKAGDAVALFNGSDGEWLAVLASGGKKNAVLTLQKMLRPQGKTAGPWLLCAPLKGGKTEWVVEKATELGVSRICPVLTQFTVVDRINEARLVAIATEAAEQCERLDVPAIEPLKPLDKLLAGWPKDRRLLFGDESGAGSNARKVIPSLGNTDYGLLIGPEGGFSGAELELLRLEPYVTGICLGPSILKADTAAVAGLALLQAFSEGWEEKPAFRN